MSDLNGKLFLKVLSEIDVSKYYGPVISYPRRLILVKQNYVLDKSKVCEEAKSLVIKGCQPFLL